MSDNMCPCMMTPCPHTSEFGTGAMPAPGREWEVGRTAGEIALIHFVQRTRDYMKNPSHEEADYLSGEADYLLQWLEVEKA